MSQIFGSAILHALETKNPMSNWFCLSWKKGKGQRSKFSCLCSHRVWIILKGWERPKFQIFMSMFPPSLDDVQSATWLLPKMTSAILYLWRKCRNRVTIIPSFKRSHWQLFGAVNASVSATETQTNGQLVRRRTWSCCSFNCCLWFRVLIVVTPTALGGRKHCNFHYQDN